MNKREIDTHFGGILACVVLLLTLLMLAMVRPAHASTTYTSDLLDEWTGETRTAVLYSPLSGKPDDRGLFRARLIHVPKLADRNIMFCVQSQWGDRAVNCMMVFQDGTGGFFATYLRAQET